MKKNAYTQIQKNKKVKVIEIKFEYRLNFNFDNLPTELLQLDSGVNKKKVHLQSIGSDIDPAMALQSGILTPDVSEKL